jgi:hypothetical protein
VTPMMMLSLLVPAIAIAALADSRLATRRPSSHGTLLVHVGAALIGTTPLLAAAIQGAAVLPGPLHETAILTAGQAVVGYELLVGAWVMRTCAGAIGPLVRR